MAELKRATNPKPNRPLSTRCRDSRKNRGLSVDQLAKLAKVFLVNHRFTEPDKPTVLTRTVESINGDVITVEPATGRTRPHSWLASALFVTERDAAKEAYRQSLRLLSSATALVMHCRTYLRVLDSMTKDLGASSVVEVDEQHRAEENSLGARETMGHDVGRHKEYPGYRSTPRGEFRR